MEMMRPQSDSVAEPGGGGHEEMDVRTRGIVLFTAALVAVIVAAMLVLAAMMRHYEAREDRGTPRPALFNDPTGQYPGPDLQDNPTADVIRMRAEEEAARKGYGWVDRKAGVARLPVERAMDILAAKGLPTEESHQGSSSSEKPGSR